MSQGRKPKPTALRLLEGNPGKRPLPKKEPNPEKYTKIPWPPSFLDDVAKNEWRRVAPALHNLGLLTKVDRSSLAAYCQLYSRWLQAEENIRKEGMIITAANGFLMQNPSLAICNKALQQMKAFLVEFGMTPSSRSKVIVEPDDPDDDGLLT